MSRLRTWLALPQDLPPEQWLRPGLPGALGWIAAGLAPFFLSGPVRAMTTLPLGWALAVALAATVVVAAPFWPWLRGARLSPSHWPLSSGLAASAALSVFSLYDRWFGGLVVIVDGDSGTHVALRDTFVAAWPQAYAGFVSFYGVTWWIERVVHSAYSSFAACFYAAVLVWSAIPLLAASVCVASDRDRKFARSAFLMAAGAWLLLLYFVALPLFHYHQAEGFFVHVFGVIPLAFIWLVDGTVRPARARILALLVGVVAYRYTYGLNLGDLLLAIATLVVIDAGRLTTSRRAGSVIRSGAVLLVVAAGVCYQRLTPVLSLDGWIIPHDLRRALAAQWVLVAAEAAALALPWARRRLRGRSIEYWLRLPVAFGAGNAAVLTRLLLWPPPHQYYVVKYGFHSLLLLLAATVPLFAALIAGPVDAVAQPRLVTSRPTQVSVGLIGGSIAVAAFWATQSIAVYRAGFLERAFGRPPFHVIKPLADLGAWSRIERTLKREHREFGGYLTTFYPVMNFMNAAFGFSNGGIQFYYGRPAREGAGYCDFWEAGPPATWLEADFPQRATRDRWNQSRDRQCVSYPAHWNPELIRTLCWICN